MAGHASGTDQDIVDDVSGFWYLIGMLPTSLFSFWLTKKDAANFAQKAWMKVHVLTLNVWSMWLLFPPKKWYHLLFIDIYHAASFISILEISFNLIQIPETEQKLIFHSEVRYENVFCHFKNGGLVYVSKKLQLV